MTARSSVARPRYARRDPAGAARNERPRVRPTHRPAAPARAAREWRLCRVRRCRRWCGAGSGRRGRRCRGLVEDLGGQIEVAERGLGVGPDPLSAALSILLWPSPASIRPRYTALSSRGADACPSSPLGGLGRVGCPFRICHVRHVSPASQGVVAFSSRCPGNLTAPLRGELLRSGLASLAASR